MFFLTILLHFGCQSENISSISLENFKLTYIPSPVKSGGEPNLFVSDKGQTYLSWVEYINDTTDALMFSKLENLNWTTPIEISRGGDWFVNWADFPSLVVYKNNENHMAAHWLAKRSEGTYDYDVHISQSKDGGKTWGESFIIHTDGVAAEHGFVTMLPTNDGKIFATWLDGRFTKIASSDAPKVKDDHGHGHGGAMTLRTATFDIDGNLFEEKELDNRICDCCQTTATITSNNTLVAYRDRSVDEIRDISFVHKTNGNWSTPSSVHQDHWKIAGCPVNGPSIYTNNNNTAIVWYTQADSTSQVNVAFYDNLNSRFNPPIRIDDGNPIGRVGIVLLENTVFVSWLEQVDEGAEIKLAQISNKNKKENSVTISSSSSLRKSGFPQIEKTKDKIIFAWTHVEDSKSTIKTAYWNY